MDALFPAAHEAPNSQSFLAKAYQPIIRGYFGVAATYYAIMLVTHFWMLSGTALICLALAAAITCGASVGAWVRLRNPMPAGKLEIVTGVINMLVLANVIIALQVEYSQAKLGYFVMMAMIFAFASVSMRQALVAIILVLGALFFMVGTREPTQMLIYGFVAFAAALSAFAIAFFLRRAIGIAVAARHEAERQLETAQALGEEMRQQSLTDSLTGLPNRRAFFEVLEWCAEGEVDHWLVLLDLDGFKAVNDHYGHLIGDALLQAVALRLQDYCGPFIHVSRMGGDEFNVILSTDETENEIENWSKGLLEHLAETYLIEDRLIQISGSIGCHRIAHDEPDANSIQRADYALLHAKRNGKNRVVVFREEHAKDASIRFTIEQALRVADFSTEIEMLYQPQHDLETGKTVSAEALARWNSPTLGSIEPDKFIKIAEECGLISRITIIVIDKALAALKSWDKPISVAINLSGHDLISDQMIDRIIECVQASGLPPALIEFEVTETAMMPDTRRASANLYRLSELGHPISLDDFGTGYSNFNYLRSLPISKLKVDRSFMENLGDPMTEKLLRSLVGLANTLNVNCLLEGIEDELELLIAKRVGARSVQGYHFGRPMASVELIEFIEQQAATAKTSKARSAKPRAATAPDQVPPLRRATLQKRA